MSDNLIYVEGTGSKKIRTHEKDTNVHTEAVDLEDVYAALQLIANLLKRPLYMDPATGATRVSGTATVTFASNQDIRTVTGLTNVGGFSAAALWSDSMRSNWAVNVRGRIT